MAPRASSHLDNLYRIKMKASYAEEDNHDFPSLRPTARSRRDMLKIQERPSFPSTQELTIWKHPNMTLRFFWDGVTNAVATNAKWPYCVQRTKAVVLAKVVCILVLLGAKAGLLCELTGVDMQSGADSLQEAVMEALFWFGCGFLSSAGLGSGVQTGALFLFPHICRVALRLCAHAETPQSSLASLLWAVFWPGFWSGGGSAVGELVSFVLARLIRRAGGDPFDLLTGATSDTTEEADSVTSESSEELDPTRPLGPASDPSWMNASQLLLANTKDTMQDQLKENTFWKVFALAVVPNAVFDIAGLVCGASESISMWEFFLATWTAKALVRTPLQTCGLALAVVEIVSPESLFVYYSDGASPASQDMGFSSWNGVMHLLQHWGRMALHKFVGDDEEFEGMFAMEIAEEEEASLLSTLFFGSLSWLWSIVTILMFGFFVISIVEQIAQHHVRTHPDLQRYHDKRATKKTL